MQAEQWFQQAEVAPLIEERTDHYLVLRELAFISIKLRGGRFEVKRRDADFGPAVFGSRVNGRLALWRKWGFAVTGEGATSPPDHHWATVDKERHLRKYSVGSAGVLSAVDPKTFPEQGCTIELTRLKVRGAEWWSVGFEAFGPDEAQLQGTLKCVAALAFDLGDHPEFRREDSFDYPEWLSIQQPACSA